MAGLFRPRGVLSNDAKYASPARVISLEEMLQYRDTWTEPLAPEFSFDDIMAKARTPTESKPPEKLEMSDSGFKVTDQAKLTEQDRVVRHIQSVLNRLTEANYDVLIASCRVPEAFEKVVIDQWVARIFEKALDEPMFCPNYAKVALDMAKYEFDTFSSKGVRTAIVQRAQAVHEQDKHDLEQAMAAAAAAQRHQQQLSQGKKKGATPPPPQPSEEELAGMDKLRKKKLANIKLIGELYKCSLLADRIIIMIVSEVLLNHKRPPEVDVEMTAELLKAVGVQLDTKGNMEGVYDRVELLTKIQPPYSKRVTFQLMNLLDLRKAKWEEKKRDAPPPPQQYPTPTSKTGASPVTESAPSLPKKTQLSFPPLPPQLTTESEKAIETQLKAAALDQFNAQEKVQAAVKSLRQLETGLRDALIVHCAATRACSLTQSVLAEAIFNAFLMKGVWENHEVGNGLAWCIATAIIDGVTEDIPKFFPRLAEYLVSAGWPLDRLSSEIFGKAAWCLDSAFQQPENDASMRLEACEAFGNLWDLTVKEVSNNNSAVKVTPNQVLDGLSSAKMTPFLREQLPDMLHTLQRFEVCTEQNFKAWRSGKGNAGGNAAALCAEIDLLQ